MIPDDPDTQLRKLIAKAMLPPDLCASDPEGIEAMLDAAKGDPLPEDRIERILKKARGELPVGEREDSEPVWTGDVLSDEEEALLALHKNEGEELPPEIKEKLRRLREIARSTPKEGEASAE